MPHALVVDDDSASLRALAALVRREGFSADTAATLAEARKHLAERPAGVVLCDLVLPDGMGTELLDELAGDAAVEIILVTANASVETAIQALRLGAYDYLTKPVDIPRLKSLLAQVRRTQALKEEVHELRRELRDLGHFGPLVGTSRAMQEVYDLIERVAPTDATVLVVGESGTGKELVAQTTHRLSRRRHAAYLAVNCGAVSATLFESELFGHERGSFTGAERQHRGVFERAHGGTLFLDEITEMPLELQVKLLRALETGSIVRVGGEAETRVDVRVAAATNRDPEEAVEAGVLRQDLYYRLKVFPISLPPLREREGDIERLAAHFLTLHNQAAGTHKHFAPETLERLARHTWPGNVRELKNVVERAFILAGDAVTADCLPPEVSGRELPRSPYLHVRVGTTVEDVQRRLLFATLEHFDGDKRLTADALGVSLKTVYNWLNACDQNVEDEPTSAG
jgi:two-component system response regulator AtoC